MPDPLTVGRRAAARLEEAILLALEEYRDQGYISTIRLAERIGWDAEGMPSPNGQGYGRLAVIGLLYKLYLAGRVEPAHQPNRRGHWGGWRISDEEYARRSGLDAESISPPESLHIAAALLSGEVSLAEYPMPPAEGLMPPLPTAVRFPDATEYELRHWEQILTFTVQWLNETGILTLADVPVRMLRGPGYLVNTEPIHSDGRPMVKRTQAGGPDQHIVGVHQIAGDARLLCCLPYATVAGDVPARPRRSSPDPARRRSSLEPVDKLSTYPETGVSCGIRLSLVVLARRFVYGGPAWGYDAAPVGTRRGAFRLEHA